MSSKVKNGVVFSLMDTLPHKSLEELLNPPTNCSHSQTISSCYVFGTEHVLTFDGERIDVISTAACQFDLVYTCPAGAVVDAVLDISIINVAHGETSRVNCVQVEYGNFVVRLCADQTARVNGKLVQSMLSPNEELMVYTGTSGIELSIQTAVMATPVIVTMTSSSMVRVSLPSSYSRKLCGLCGNYDGNGTNDLVISNGIDVSSYGLYQRSAAIAGFHLREDSTLMGCDRSSAIVPFIPSNCAPVASDLQDPEYCGVYQSATFESCSNDNPDLAAMFEMLCEDDFCENYLNSNDSNDDALSSTCFESGDCVYNSTIAKQAVNSIAEVFVDECRSRGVNLEDWRADYLASVCGLPSLHIGVLSEQDDAYFAELTCRGDTVYSFYGDTCPLVCGGRETDRCEETNRDGCECQDGLYRDGNTGCVEAQDCGCKDPTDGSYHMIGDTWLDSTCSTNFSCPAGDLQQSQVVCSEFAFCENADGVYQCTCNTDYAGDGYTCLRQCPVGQQPTDDQEMCRDCPVGTYQPLENQQACLLCPEGEVTPGLGATSEDDCSTLLLAPDTLLDPSACTSGVVDVSFETVVSASVLPDGLPYGDNFYTKLYTSTNGIITFGTPVVGKFPSNIETTTTPISAPFWFPQDFRGNYAGTMLCRSSFSLLDTDSDKADESRSVLSVIKLMLSASELLTGLDFMPVYGFVATWHRSVPFPHQWYSPDGPFAELKLFTYTPDKLCVFCVIVIINCDVTVHNISGSGSNRRTLYLSHACLPSGRRFYPA
ncbi:zonadhesin-like [Watersipora subatra]|uniref:zonadhesin-like n=1 Tax=Watersipora subatra TaxID=2589382 RepID=UPI00355B0D6F